MDEFSESFLSRSSNSPEKLGDDSPSGNNPACYANPRREVLGMVSPI